MTALSRWGIIHLGALASLLIGCGSEDPQAEPSSGTGSGGSASTADAGTGATVEGPPIFINEIVASNVRGIRDSEGGTGDWLELYNAGQQDVDLGGYSVSDNVTTPLKGVLEAGVVVPAGGVLLLWADSDVYQSDVSQGIVHLPFNLAREGEGVYLFNPNQELIDGISYVDAPSDFAYARFPDGTGAFTWCSDPSPKQLNGDACGS
jgi:hypothetical protein